MERQRLIREICKFLSSGFFVTMGASWYLAHYRIAVPFFNTAMTPDFLFVRGFIHLALFLFSFYWGYLRQSRP